ncbi:MAG: dihydropteroate synthase [Armatimonadetes bacterium]|nr:dihydropteroate synthase [Armatimonadota bacterium]
MKQPLIMGVINVTPDSFSDGGRFTTAEDAVREGLQMLNDGADILDVGGESTRPNAAPVSEEEELARVLEVVRKLAKHGATVSIDTYKPEVAQRCIEAGASIVNDVTGLRNPVMRRVIASADVKVCIMHMLGSPQTMQSEPTYANVLAEVRDYLAAHAALAINAGIKKENIWIDPGIGFGKTTEHNLSLLKGLPELVEVGYPVLIGVSRKSFLGRIIGSESLAAPLHEREAATIAAQAYAQLKGASIIRTHRVKEAVQAAKLIARLSD